MAVPHAKVNIASDQPHRFAEEAPPPRGTGVPAHELHAMLERHYGPRADLPAPNRSRLLPVVDPLIEVVSRAAGIALFAAALAITILLIW